MKESCWTINEKLKLKEITYLCIYKATQQKHWNSSKYIFNQHTEEFS